MNISSLPIETITRGLIPNHIKILNMVHNGAVEDGAFPQNLDTLSFRSTIPIRLVLLPQQLLFLYLDNFNSQPLEKSMFPSTLETLIINNYNQPLTSDSLPPHLNKLRLIMFNHQLNVGVFPQSLVDLHLASFNYDLIPFVLPPYLKILRLDQYTNTFKSDTLPSTLTHLELSSFKGSFQFVPQMNNLLKLSLFHTHSSAASMISNTKKIRIKCRTMDKLINLQDTLIQHLELHLERSSLNLSSNLVPKQIKTLQLLNIFIESNGLLPTSCLKLQTNTHDLDLNLIPPSTKHTYHTSSLSK